ncbi:MAG: stage II sporulation protein M [Bacteroidota bacterium]
MREAWHRTRPYLRAAAGIFAAGVLGGTLLVLSDPDAASGALSLLARSLSPVARRVAATGIVGRILIIWRHNLAAAGLIFAAGLTLIGPVLLLGANGSAVGLLGMDYHLAGRLSWGRFLLGLLPHGIFEIPAVLLTAALALRLGLKVWGLGRAGASFRRDTVALAPVIVGFLLVAAILEVTVSPRML